MKPLVWLGRFNFISDFSEFLRFEHSLCHLIVLQFGFGIAHSYALNVKPSSEIRNYIFSSEFAKPRLFRMSLGFRHCEITIQLLPIALFGLAYFYQFSRPYFTMEGKSSTQI